MNKNSYSSWNNPYGLIPNISLGYNDMPQKKEKTMNREYPFHVGWEDFKTLEDATKAARRFTMQSKEDTVIRQDVAVVKFPVPDYEVETLTA